MYNVYQWLSIDWNNWLTDKVPQRISPRVSLAAVHHQRKQSRGRSRRAHQIHDASQRSRTRRSPAAAGDARSSKSARSTSSAGSDTVDWTTVAVAHWTASIAATRQKMRMIASPLMLYIQSLIVILSSLSQTCCWQIIFINGTTMRV